MQEESPRVTSPAIPFHQALDDATPNAFVTPTLIAINTVIFLLMCIKGVPFFSPGAREVLPWGANFGPLTTSGQWWRLFTACFLHFGIFHVAVNMFVLWQVGIFTEKLFGNLRYLALYLIAGVFGNIAGLFLHPYAVGAGASGAIFGVYGGLLAFLLFERGVVPAKAAMSIAKSAVIFLLYNFVYGLASSKTDLVAHIGGLIAGFLAGCVLARPLASRAQHVNLRLALTVSACATLLAFTAMRLLPKEDPAQKQWNLVVLTSPSILTKTKDRIVYTGTATRQDAEAVSQALYKANLFGPPDVVVLLHKDATGATLSIPLRDASLDAKGKPRQDKSVLEQGPASPLAPWNDPQVIATMRQYGPPLAAAVGLPFTIELVTSKGEPRRAIPIEAAEIIIGTRDRIAYAGLATSDDATKLGDALKTIGFFQDRGSLVLLNRTPAGPELAFVLANNAWDDQNVVLSIASIGRQVAPTIGGLPLRIHLLDPTHHLRKEIVLK